MLTISAPHLALTHTTKMISSTPTSLLSKAGRSLMESSPTHVYLSIVSPSTLFFQGLMPLHMIAGLGDTDKVKSMLSAVDLE